MHVRDGEEEGEVDQEWTEHLPLEGREEVGEKQEGADANVEEAVEKEIALYR